MDTHSAFSSSPRGGATGVSFDKENIFAYIMVGRLAFKPPSAKQNPYPFRLTAERQAEGCAPRSESEISMMNTRWCNEYRPATHALSAATRRLLTVLSNFVFNSVIGCSNLAGILITERLRQAVSRSFPYVDPLFYLSSFQTPSEKPPTVLPPGAFLRRVAADDALRGPVCNRYTIGRARYRQHKRRIYPAALTFFDGIV